MAFTTTALLRIKWTESHGRKFEDTNSSASMTKSDEISLVGITTTYQTIYDASQTTVPALGDDDPGDTPFIAAIQVAGASCILKLTDDAAGVTYQTIPADKWYVIPSGILGSTESSVLEQLDIKTSSGTLTSPGSEALIQHD